LTFQAWAMLIVGGSGNNRGALLGALVVWTIWTLAGIVVTKLVPPAHAAQGAAVQVILIGAALVAMLMLRPRGLIGEEAVVSRHASE
jgi:branched-chain amino acid transport system permease protein